MKRVATIALTLLFVTSLTGAAMAERTGLSITGSTDIMARQDENQVNTAVVPAGGLGNNGVDNRVEQKINLNVDADLTDNVSFHLGLEGFGAWGDATAAAPNLNGQLVTLTVEEAYIVVKELFIEQLTIKAGVMNAEYSLRDNGDSMFLSIPEIGAWATTLDYDPLYVDLLVCKVNETRRANAGASGTTDRDLYALVVEYYLENESKVQVIAVIDQDEDADRNISQISAGVVYNVLEDLEVYAQIGSQGGEIANNVD